MKKFIPGVIFTLICLVVSVGNAGAGENVYLKFSGALFPEQENQAAISGQGVFQVEQEINYGVYGEAGLIRGPFSLGLEGGYQKLIGEIFIPGARASETSIDIISLMVSMCMNLKNDSKFTPFGCGRTGVLFLEPELTVFSPGGGKVNYQGTEDQAGAYAFEAGLKYEVSQGIDMFGSYVMQDTFHDVRTAAGGAVANFDLTQHFIKVGVEF